MLRRATAGAALAAAVLALSGCGVTGTDFRPGVAADVGDERFYDQDVDDAADDTCAYLTDQGGDGAFMKSELRSELLRLVVQRSATEQLLADSDQDAPAVPGSAVQSFVDQQFPGATEGQTDGLEVIAEAVLVLQSGLTTLGTQLLTDEGTPVDPNQQDAAFQRGTAELSEWLMDNEVELNPVYGVTLDDDGQLLADADETSVVVSDEAGYAIPADPAAEPDKKRQAYIDGLPASQTCG